MLFVNGKIYSLDKDNSIYEALAVRNKKIADLGKTDDILRKSPKAKKIIEKQNADDKAIRVNISGFG
ncbi:MAG: hypothetical protein H0S78_00985 [Tissierellales bacterium]|nr:hypothetical protein [Tissierellales bacterium]